MGDLKIDLHDLKGKIIIKSKTKFKIKINPSNNPISITDVSTGSSACSSSTENIQIIASHGGKDHKQPKFKITINPKTSTVVKYRSESTVKTSSTHTELDNTREEINTTNSNPKPRNNVLYDINRGFMLANNFYDTDSTVPRINPIGWWHSEKFDGVRAIWDGMNFYTRNLSRIAAPQWFKDKMPSNIALDGEFFIKRGHFNTTSGIVRKLVPIQYEWEPMRFMVFDVPSSQESFEVRLGIIQKTIATIGLPLVCIVQVHIENLNDLMSRHKLLVSRGAEGSMLRKPYSKYVPGRSESILKVKDQSEEDAYILNWDEGNGKNKGKLGALWIKWVNPAEIRERYHLNVTPYTEFRVGSGFKDIDRCKIGDAPIKYPKNDIVKVGFFGLQDSGKPRHPAFKGLREH